MLKYHQNKAAKAAEAAKEELEREASKAKVDREKRSRDRVAPPPPVLLALPPPTAGGTGAEGNDHASDDEDDLELVALRNTAFPLVSGYELSESCCAAARAALDELRRLGIHFPLDVIMKNSVDELARKHARITAVVNGFDGSNKSNTSDLKLFYTLLLTTGAGYLVSSWASPENLGRMLQQTLKKKGSSNKAGCGMDKVFGFKSGDTAVDPGLGAGTTALYWLCARRWLREENLGDLVVQAKRVVPSRKRPIEATL